MTSTAADTFARFVDVLADSLDDHDADGAALAAQLHLSRFHCDRLVSAAAGEPPAALRRRVLLERAAYRLITTDHDVLRVAVEAGYASNEAFTRAFARAFGRAPSRWRARPASYRLDAPSEVHFTPPGGLRVPAHREVTAMDLLTPMVDHHVWLVGRLVDECGRLAPQQLDARINISVDGIDHDPTVRSLLARLVGQMAMWDAATESLPYDIDAERAETLDEIGAKLTEVGPRVPDQGPRHRRRRPPRRDVRRRDVHPGPGVHVRRHDRPRADLCRAPAGTGVRCPVRRRARGLRRRRPNDLGGRAGVTLTRRGTPCAGRRGPRPRQRPMPACGRRPSARRPAGRRLLPVAAEPAGPGRCRPARTRRAVSLRSCR